MSDIEQLEREGRWQQLLAELERRLDAAVSVDERVALLARVMILRRDKMNQRARAAMLARKILALDPEHEGAKGVLGKLDTESEPTCRTTESASESESEPMCRTTEPVCRTTEAENGGNTPSDPGGTMGRRWKDIGTDDHDPASGTPPPTSDRVKVVQAGDRLTITYRHFEWVTFLACLGAGGLFWILFLTERLDGCWNDFNDFLFFGVGVLLTVGVLASAFNRTVIRVARGRVTSRTFPLALPIPRSAKLAHVRRFETDLRRTTGQDTPSLGAPRRTSSFDWRINADLGGDESVTLLGGLAFREENEARAITAALNAFHRRRGDR